MIFFNDEKIYFNCFDFLISDYDYRITYRNTKDGLHSSELILENDKKPKIVSHLHKKPYKKYKKNKYPDRKRRLQESTTIVNELEYISLSLLNV